MTDEADDDSDDDLIDVEYTPEQTDVCAGTFVIFDTSEFALAMNCLGVQMTEEGGLYVLDRDTKMLRTVIFDDGKVKPKLNRVQ